ncbi:MAG: hypothetical protein HUU49_04825 [Candidatus Buchananbacteria bacterium]|nr:hypothetical protein [Candidatus Buchananbacteria bacterium]
MKKIIIIFLLAILGLTLGSPALAQENKKPWVEEILGGPLIPSGCTESQANAGSSQVTKCGLNEMLQVGINFSKILLALTGSAALLMFVYGGAMFIMAAGKQEMVQKGKAAMTAAVIGIVIILGAYLIVNFTILALTKGEVGGNATIFGQPFNQTP